MALFMEITDDDLAGPRIIKAPWSRDFSIVMGSFNIGSASL